MPEPPAIVAVLDTDDEMGDEDEAEEIDRNHSHLPRMLAILSHLAGFFEQWDRESDDHSAASDLASLAAVAIVAHQPVSSTHEDSPYGQPDLFFDSAERVWRRWDPRLMAKIASLLETVTGESGSYPKDTDVELVRSSLEGALDAVSLKVKEAKEARCITAPH